MKPGTIVRVAFDSFLYKDLSDMLALGYGFGGELALVLGATSGGDFVKVLLSSGLVGYINRQWLSNGKEQ